MHPPCRARSAEPAILWSAGVTVVMLAFGRIQNQGRLVGGDISVAKTLWLNLTILSFLVLPALWWRDRRVDRRLRTIFGVIFAAFAVRAAVELPILYLTDWWRCSYGIAHDLVTAAAAVFLFARARVRVRDSGPLLWLIVALLFVEAAFAYAFCSVADPASGTYFASDDAAFQAINRATWGVVIAGYSALLFILWFSGRRTSPSDAVGP